MRDSLEVSIPGDAIDFKAPGGGVISSGIAVSGDANWSASGGENATALNSGEASVQNVAVVIGGSIVMQSAPTDGAGN